MRNPVNYIVVQLGHAVFGAGEDEESAISDAEQWLDNAYPEDLIVPEYKAVDGDFILMHKDHKDFDSYLKNQGGYEKVGSQWFTID